VAKEPIEHLAVIVAVDADRACSINSFIAANRCARLGENVYFTMRRGA
jgi:hypothetical protein